MWIHAVFITNPLFSLGTYLQVDLPEREQGLLKTYSGHLSCLQNPRGVDSDLTILLPE